MTIGKRLGLTLGMSLFALVCISVYSLWSLYVGKQRFDSVQIEIIPAMVNLDKTKAEITNMRVAAYRHLIVTTAADKAAMEQQMHNADAALDALLAQYEREDVQGNPDDEKLAAADRNNVAAYRHAREAFLEASRVGDHARAAEMLLTGSLNHASGVMRGGLTAHIDYNVRQSEKLREASDIANRRALWIMGSTSVTVILLTLWLSVRLFGIVDGGLKRIRSALGDVSHSLDLTIRVPISGMDEIGQSAEAFNQLMDGFRAALGHVRTSSDTIVHATNEIAAGNMDLSSRTEQQAASLEETASSMSQLTETVRHNAEQAREASTLASNAESVADAGDVAMKSMVGTIGEINTSSQKISDITALIEGIAFQTNILALNAAVEAARAGEQGRGFAVVAAEVRGLAQRSSVAAKEIKALIESSAMLVAQGSKQAAETGKTMEQIRAAIRQVSHIVGEIASASDEQSTGIEQVNQAVNQMDAVTQQNAALVEEASAATQSLEQQAARLKEVVARFRLAAADSTASPSNGSNKQAGFSPIGSLSAACQIADSRRITGIAASVALSTATSI
ncbi:methyl-accepting chemotaxis protein [Trinickia terrae]|uniref:Methyl-accepting chemotaxis protein n=2 Tax=Trinickia terrae TaxID=2571161 RepID=A0A4V5PIV2_9BURK|nr:methyl-accepting chemotaxis protein [Trinickia terrae]